MVCVDPDAVAGAAAAKRQITHFASALYAGQRTKLRQQFLLEGDAVRSLHGHAAKIDIGYENAILAETCIHAQQSSEASREEERANNQNERERHLRYDQELA